jgi:AraC-like DNA-binding protein
VKEHLHDTFLHEHSLTNLARQFGVNTNKLMNSFKLLFGKSIFEFIQELRMDYAQHLLREQDLQITEVARTIGYKNPNHFSAAFKRRFGFCPSAIR